ncbi:hypothetical protein K469DRAFT_686324 [Zopfia rhizophila CBS 207.26]|uniref:Mid2 domain-containing protein n=1 Tax=Zopfia rhizophila CBS 207.26 TaxID=1314779 RepID=A0A6A6E5M9_9PEZI|nr:hypothetical protein K469DRAFT_686324 [Zopfia rhizophila CBS 207.26]
MPILLEIRQNCDSNTQYYVCSSNGFKGCCAVDPCNLSNGCPDNSDSPAPSSAPASNGASTLRPATTTALLSTQFPAEPTSVQVEASRSASAVETIASVNGGQTIFITVTHDSSPTVATAPSLTPDPPREGKSSIGAIVGGVVGGLVVIVLAILLFFLLRRRKRAKNLKEATLPPSYANGDMSEHLASIGHNSTTANSDERENAAVRGSIAYSGTTVASTNHDEKSRISNIERDLVPQLDSTMIRPTNEMGADPLGSIPELPASEKNPFATPHVSVEQSKNSESSGMQPSREKRSGDADNHVMSWAQYNSMGT